MSTFAQNLTNLGNAGIDGFINAFTNANSRVSTAANTMVTMAENAIKGTNDSDNIVQLMAGQETGDSQQLAIMEAIADLYDAVAAMIPE